MRGVVLCVALVFAAGCAEVPGQETNEATDDANETGSGNGTVEPPVSGAGPELAGRLVATVENTTVAAGTPFNVTLDYVDDNATDLGNASWQATFSNATGNASYNGTGLPATFVANLTLLGNVSLAAVALQGNQSVALEPILLSVVAAGPVDPCADAAVQAPFHRSGTAYGGALGGGFYSTVTFDLEPCQTRMEVMHTYLQTGGDRDMYLFDPDGNEVAAAESGAIGREGPIVVDDLADLAKVGTWTLEIYAFAGGPTTYEVDVTFG